MAEYRSKLQGPGFRAPVSKAPIEDSIGAIVRRNFPGMTAADLDKKIRELGLPNDLSAGAKTERATTNSSRAIPPSPSAPARSANRARTTQKPERSRSKPSAAVTPNLGLQSESAPTPQPELPTNPIKKYAPNEPGSAWQRFGSDIDPADPDKQLQRLRWRGRAACRGMELEVFTDSNRSAEASRACNIACSVAAQCISFALSDPNFNPIGAGMMGGQTEKYIVEGRENLLSTQQQ